MVMNMKNINKDRFYKKSGRKKKNNRSKLKVKIDLTTKTSREVSEKFREDLLQRQTPSEIECGKILKSLNIRFSKQQIIHYSKGKFYIMDFYIPAEKLCIEIDGKYHGELEQIKKDINRERNLTKMKIYTIRFTNEEVFKENFVKDKLRLYINF